LISTSSLVRLVPLVYMGLFPKAFSTRVYTSSRDEQWQWAKAHFFIARVPDCGGK
jgi:hypothetical protein